MSAVESPLTGPPPPEIPLANAPLVRVISQVRFPLVASIENQGFVGPFQEAIRHEYPLLRQENSQEVVLGSEGAVTAKSNVSWRFSDPTKHWGVTLAPGFLALETTCYASRADFLNRLRIVLIALREHVNPAQIDRLGIRYIDRIVGENLRDFPRLVRPEVAGISGTPLAGHAKQSVMLNLFNLPEDEGQLLARWAHLPANSTIDPSAVKAVDEPSWILDIDAFVANQSAFDVDGILLQAKALAERVYSFFRWVVTDEFHIRYGGQP